MMRETNSCLWPRAIIDVIPTRGSRQATANILRNFDPGMVEDPVRLRLDITHLQPTMGSPVHIAQHINRRLRNKRSGLSATMGVASDPFVAAYAAGSASAGSIKAIAPWEVRARLDSEPMEVICQLAPGLAKRLRQVGIYTGAQIAELPLSVVKRVFGDIGIELWRACRGENNAAAFEVANDYGAIRCRGNLPPRTSSRRSLNSHLNRICNRFVSVLRERNRHSGNITLAMREIKQTSINGLSLIVDESELAVKVLFREAQKIFLQHWQGDAIQYLELSATQLYCPGGQLELFDVE